MKVLACASLLLLAGCATGGGTATGPNGRPMFHIEAASTASAYTKAAGKCPSGYDLLGQRQQGLFHILDIECR